MHRGAARKGEGKGGGGRRDEVMERLRRRTGPIRPVVYPPQFAALAGGMHAGALLAQLLYWSDRAASPKGWVYKNRSEWCAELGLSRCELETARCRLRSRGLIQESYHVAANRRVLHMRLCFERLFGAIDALPAGAGAGDDTVAAPDADAEEPAAEEARPDAEDIAAAGADAGGRTGGDDVAVYAGHLRDLIPGLQNELAPGSPGWNRMMRVFKETAQHAHSGP